MNENILERLQQPLDPGRVRQRKGPGGRSLAYLEGHDVISTANDLFGFEWSSQLVGAVEHVATAPRHKTVWSKRERRRVPVKDEKGSPLLVPTGMYHVTVAVSAAGVTKSDVGRCSYQGDTPEAHEMAVAGAVTDAMKRAFRQFGSQFGNSLYDRDTSPNGKGKPRGNPAAAAFWKEANAAIKDGLSHLEVKAVAKTAADVGWEKALAALKRRVAA